MIRESEKEKSNSVVVESVVKSCEGTSHDSYAKIRAPIRKVPYVQWKKVPVLGDSDVDRFF